MRRSWLLAPAACLALLCGDSASLQAQQPDARGPAPSLAARLTSERRTIDVLLIRFPPDARPFVFDGTKITLRLEDLQRRAYAIRGLGNGVSRRDTTTAPGHEEGAADVALVRFPLPSAIAPNFYTTRMTSSGAARDGSGRPLAVDGNVLQPVYVTDPADVARVRATYLGRTVFGIGSILGTCRRGTRIGSVDVPSARVVDVRSRTGVAKTLALDPIPPQPGDYRTTFLTFDPIVVTLERSTPPSISDDGSNAIPAPDTVACPRFEFAAAGAWDVARKIDLRPPVDPAWAPRFRAAIADNEAIVGMTHEMVAAVWGYPPQFGTIAQLDALDRWTYEGGPKYDHSVDFRAGRVVRVTVAPPGP